MKSNNQTLFEKLYIVEISSIAGKILILGCVIILCIVIKWQYQFNEKEANFIVSAFLENSILECKKPFESKGSFIQKQDGWQFDKKEFRIFSKDSYFYLQDCTKRVK